MNDFAAMKISASGMSAQRERIRVISENLANIHTTGPNGPYQRKQAIFESAPPSFESQLDAAVLGALTPEELAAIREVSVSEVRSGDEPPILRYEPGHPHADSDGYVAYPNISIIREMADLMEATRSYEASLAASKSAKDMMDRAIDVLG